MIVLIAVALLQLMVNVSLITFFLLPGNALFLRLHSISVVDVLDFRADTLRSGIFLVIFTVSFVPRIKVGTFSEKLTAYELLKLQKTVDFVIVNRPFFFPLFAEGQGLDAGSVVIAHAQFIYPRIGMEALNSC